MTFAEARVRGQHLVEVRVHVALRFIELVDLYEWVALLFVEVIHLLVHIVADIFNPAPNSFKFWRKIGRQLVPCAGERSIQRTQIEITNFTEASMAP